MVLKTFLASMKTVYSETIGNLWTLKGEKNYKVSLKPELNRPFFPPLLPDVFM